MESIAIGLSSSELQTKLGAIDSLLGRLEKGKRGCILDATNNETKKKIYSSSVNLLKDVNTKVVHPAFNIINAIIDDPAFQNLKAITFDILLVKFGDAKPQVRSRASEVMAKLMMSQGDAAGCDKLLSQVNLGHRNGRVRELILHTLMQLIEVHDINISNKVDVIKKVASLLNDAQPTVRQVAVETLGMLYKIYGNKVLTTQLQECGVRPQIIQQVQQYGFQFTASSSSSSSSSSSISPCSSSGNFLSTATTTATSLSSSSEGGATAVKTSTGSDGWHDAQMNHSSTNVSTEGYIGKYAPAYYLSLLFEAPPKEFKIKVEPVRLYSERELENVMAGVAKSLENTDDWEVRLKALATLQGVALGDGMEYSAFPVLLRSIHALLISQVSDLRSTLCKEACRTVAVLARTLSSSFNEMALLLIPALIKQASVKTQIMASAAYRSLFTLMTASSSGGHQKLLHIFFEHTGNKNAMVSTRRISIECICVAVALWPSDYLKKETASLKIVVKTGAADADKEVRKAARQLFWVMQANPTLTNEAEKLYNSLESATQKHIQQEKTSPTDGDLEQLLSRPFPPADKVMPKPFTLPPQDSHVATKTARKPASSSVDSHPKSRDSISRPTSSDKLLGASRLSIGASTTDFSDAKSTMVSQRAASGTRGRRVSMGVGMSAPITSADDNALPSRLSLSSGPSRYRTSMAPQRQLVQNSTSTLQEPPTDIICPPEAPPSSSSSQRPETTTHFLSSSNKMETERSASGESQTVVNETVGVNSKATLLRHGMTGPRRVACQVKQEESASATPTIISSQRTNSSGVDKKEAGSGLMGNTVGVEEMVAKSEDSHWDTRLEGIRMLHAKLESLEVVLESQDKLSVSQINTLDAVLDAVIARLDDAHHKITTACIESLHKCVEKFAYFSGAKLTAFLPSLFSRLADRRPHIREKSNSLLNVIRSAYDAYTLVAALAPRMSEVPGNIRAAVLQFLAVTVPHAEQYFEIGHNTSSFLLRLSNMLGATGSSKPSLALITAGNRLTELVYKVAPSVTVAQVAVMPLQQQLTLKKALESSVPHFEHQLHAEIARAGSNYQKQKQQNKLSGGQNRSSEEVNLVGSEIGVPSVNEDVCDSSNHKMGRPVFLDSSVIPLAEKKVAVVPSSSRSPLATMKDSHSSSNAQLINNDKTMSPQEIKVMKKVTEYVQEEKAKDLVWILCSLRPMGNTAEKVDAIRELKKIAKSGSQEFWDDNAAQIVSVLLEAFRHDSISSEGVHNGGSDNCRFTGLTPPLKSQILAQDNFDKENENLSDDTGNSKAESMHVACKALLIIVKYRKTCLKNLMDLLISRLCTVASFAPVSISLYCEQILSALAVLDPSKFVRLVTRFVSENNVIVERERDNPSECKSNSPSHVILLSLHVIASAIKHISSSALLLECPIFLPLVLPAFKNNLVDVRKALVAVLVEIYTVIGDALHTHVASLTSPQKKLLTIYIEKRMSQKPIRAVKC